MRLYNDYAFRFVYGCDTKESNEALIALLNTVLDLKENPITQIKINNPFVLSEKEKGKTIIMDIHAKTKDGTSYDIEMQTSDYTYYLDRCVYNGGKMIENSLEKSDNFATMKKSIVISFVKDTVLREIPDFHTVCHVSTDKYSHIISDKIEWHFIELGKISDGINLETASELELLALYIKYAGDPEKEDYVDKLIKQGENAISLSDRRLNMISEDEKKWLDAWEEDLARFDLATSKKVAFDEGFGEGFDEGSLKTLCSLYKEGLLALDIAAKKAGLSEEEFEAKLAEIPV